MSRPGQGLGYLTPEVDVCDETADLEAIVSDEREDEGDWGQHAA
jgi:hypothetical protein